MGWKRYCLIWIMILCAGYVYGQSQTIREKPLSKPQKAVDAGQNDWRDTLSRDSAAPIKVVEFFDYQCPFCGATVPALEAALKNHSGQVEFILKHDPLVIHPDSMLAHEAALAAGEQGKFWEMHDLLFAHQRQVKMPYLLEYARQIHLDIPRFEQRLKSGYYKSAVEQDMAMARALGVEGTPTFFINGQKLSGAQSVTQFENAMAGKPVLGKEDPGPSVSSLDFSHSPTRGLADAPITIVEFSDLECPFCARAVPTMQEVMKQYPSQIKWVFKNYPLSFHTDAPLAHQALLAAGEQGKFWEMHDLVFADQKALKRTDLLQKARSLNLDMVKFTADLESERIKQQIEADRKEGSALRINGTPTFYINEHEYSGALTLDRFKAAIDSELSANPALHSLAKATPPVQQELIFGPANAPIALVWFSDLQSELAVKATLTVKQIMNTHPGKIRLIFKNRPLESHSNSMMLHEAAMAANAQGKFWPMHDLIVANAAKASKQDLISYAQRIGLDVKRFESDMANHTYASAIERDVAEARQRAVQGTPVFFLNATRIDGLQPLETFENLIRAETGPHMEAKSR